MQQEFLQTVSYNRFTELMQSNTMALTMFAKTCALRSCTDISFVNVTPKQHKKLSYYYV